MVGDGGMVGCMGSRRRSTGPKTTVADGGCLAFLFPLGSQERQEEEWSRPEQEAGVGAGVGAGAGAGKLQWQLVYELRNTRRRKGKRECERGKFE